MLQVLSERYISVFKNLSLVGYACTCGVLDLFYILPPDPVREESVLQDIQPDELHAKMQDPNFLEEAQLIDVREPEEVYAIFIFFI